MACVLLAGDCKMTEIIAELLETRGHEVVRKTDARTAVDLLKDGDINVGIVKSLLSVDDTMSSVRCFSHHPAELWVAAACQRAKIPYVIFHENLASDWHVRMAEEFLGAKVLTRPLSHEDDPDYEQEERSFARTIVENALNAFQAKINIPIG